MSRLFLFRLLKKTELTGLVKQQEERPSGTIGG